jgi:hypothetical protein
VKILIWHSKGGDIYWDASTPDKEKAAHLAMFREMDEQGDYECCEPEGPQVSLYGLAKTGDAAAAKKLLTIRSDKNYEYEGLSIQSVQDPLAVKA